MNCKFSNSMTAHQYLELLIAPYAENKVLRNLIKALPIPYLGSADSIIGNYYSKLVTGRVSEFYKCLEEGISEITKFDLNDDEFLHKYFITIKSVANTSRNEKIKFLSNLLINNKSPILNNNIDNYEGFLKTLDDLSFQEIQILRSIKLLEAEVFYDGKKLMHGAMFQHFNKLLEIYVQLWILQRMKLLPLLKRLNAPVA